MNNKTFWQIMFFLSIALFLTSFYYKNIWFLILCLCFAFLVRVKGDKIIFKEYNKSYEEKREKIKKLMKNLN